MRYPDEIAEEIRRRYQNKWRDWLDDPDAGPFAFSLGPPDAATITTNEQKVDEWLLAWRAWARDTPQVRLRSATRRVPYGTQDVYTHVDVPDVTTLVSLDAGNAAHWARARARHRRLREAGVGSPAVRPSLARIVDLDDYDFDLLLTVRAWFAANPRSGLTIRQVPVEGLHTKWLAKHRSLVVALLDLTAGDGDDDHSDEVDPETLDALGLQPLPSHMDIILADPKDRRLIAGIRHLRAPVEEIASLPLAPSRVLIVENKESALPVEDEAGLVIIHSLGNFLDTLPVLPWLPTTVVYWGDLDRAGFTLLSRARTRVPTLQSVLMDRDTLHRHRGLANVDPTGRVDAPDPTLTHEEHLTLEALSANGEHLRLEQERIPWTYAKTKLPRP